MQRAAKVFWFGPVVLGISGFEVRRHHNQPGAGRIEFADADLAQESVHVDQVTAAHKPREADRFRAGRQLLVKWTKWSCRAREVSSEIQGTRRNPNADVERVELSGEEPAQ